MYGPWLQICGKNSTDYVPFVLKRHLQIGAFKQHVFLLVDILFLSLELQIHVLVNFIEHNLKTYSLFSSLIYSWANFHSETFYLFMWVFLSGKWPKIKKARVIVTALKLKSIFLISGLKYYDNDIIFMIS